MVAGISSITGGDLTAETPRVQNRSGKGSASGTAVARSGRNPFAKTTAVDRATVKIDRHTLLLRGAPTAVIVGLFALALTVAVAWTRVAPQILLPWAAASFVLAVVRLAVWRQASRRIKSPQALVRFTRFHVIAMAIDGTLWGALAPVFAASGVLAHAFFPFLMAALVATSAASAGASWKAVTGFITPLLAAVAASYALFLSPGGFAIAGVVVLFGLATAFLAWHTERMITRAIRLRARNDAAFRDISIKLEASREAETRFRAIIEATSDLTMIFSADGRVLYVSPSAREALGGEPHDFVGRTTKDVVHPNDLSVFRQMGGESLSKMNESVPLPRVCLIGADSKCRTFAGRLTNMLYVSGVEGFVFTGARQKEDACALHQEAV